MKIPHYCRLMLVVVVLSLAQSCNTADHEPADATPQQDAPRAVQKDIDVQIAAFDQLMREHGVVPPDGPDHESHGVLYDLDFLINKRIDDLADFFEVANGPVSLDRDELPRGLWRFWITEAQAYDVYEWQTNASRMDPELAPSDLLIIAVADGRVIGYTFHGRYLR